MASFAKYVGGSPTNTAIGCARLGLRAALLTKVGNDHFGRFIGETLERENVGTAGVLTDADRLTALAILGIRDQDTFPLLFYRENCADMMLQPDDVDAALVQCAAAVLVSGTHLSKPNVFEASRKAVRLAKESGRKVVFDIDYRPVLWGLTSPDMGENRFVANRLVTEHLATDCERLRSHRRDGRRVPHPGRCGRHAQRAASRSRTLPCRPRMQTRRGRMHHFRRRHRRLFCCGYCMRGLSD